MAESRVPVTLEELRERPDWPKLERALRKANYDRVCRRTGATKAQARAWRAQLRAKVERDGDTVSAEGGEIRTLDQLLDAADVDRSRWRVSRWVANRWSDQWQVKAWLSAREDWETNPLPPLNLEVSEPPAEGATVVAMGDAHFGFQGREPLHDEAALARALATVREVAPDWIVILGDFLDLAAWSTKYHGGTGAYGTTRPALEALRAYLAELHAAAPKARMVYIEGNHEARISKALRERLPEAEGLLTVPGLLAVEGIDYRGPYPSGEIWIDGVRYHHGSVVRRGGGSTAAAGVAAEDHRQIHGHIHRRELASRTIHGEGGAREIWCYSPGCLCRIDGAVPGSHRPDWQQGVAVVRGGRLV